MTSGARQRFCHRSWRFPRACSRPRARAAGGRAVRPCALARRTFTDIAQRAGLRDPVVYGGIDRKRFIIETNGSGVALVDYDNDGWLDALTLSGTRLQEGTREEVAYASGTAPTNRLYRNKRNGTFEDVTEAAGLRRTGWASSVCAGDYDNDGWTDLFLTSYGRNVLYRNRGTADSRTRLPGPGWPHRRVRWGSGCTFVDYDRDGRLDLFVANYLRFDLATAAEPGKGAQLPVEGDRGQLRSQGPSDRHQPAVSQSRRRNLRRRLGYLRHREGHRALSDDRRRGRSDRRRLVRHLRRVRLHGGDPLPQQSGRHVHRRGGGKRRRATAKTATPRRAWESRSATTTATACSICSRRTSPTTFHPSIAISGRDCSRTSPRPPDSAVENRYVEWGAGSAGSG